MSSEVLPFDNQLGQVISSLLSALIHLANEAGGQEVDKLPELSIKQSNVLPPPTRPEEEQLERLLALDLHPFPTDPFPDKDPTF